nr:SpoIIE family protein phosphatase [Streptomyces zagrosensis]
MCRTRLPGNPLAPAAARQFVRAALADWAARGLPGSEQIAGQLVDDAVLLVSELVTNAVIHAGTAVVVRCALETSESAAPGATLYAEVTDHHPARMLRSQPTPSRDAPVPEHEHGAPPSGPQRVGAPPGEPQRNGSAWPAGSGGPACAISASCGAGGADGADGEGRGGGVGGSGGADGVGLAPESAEGGGRVGSGLRLVGTIAESWGTSYRRASKSVWFRLPLALEAGARAGAGLDPARGAGAGDRERGAGDRALLCDLRVADILAPAPRRAAIHRSAPGWPSHGALSFLAEASDLLTGQLDENKVASLAGQILVPKLADWCAVWLERPGAEPQLSRVWHASESRTAELRRQVEKGPPRLPAAARGRAMAWPWPGSPSAYGPGGAALACGLVAGGRVVGTLLIGRSGLTRIPDEVVVLFEDFARRVALALVAARRYTRQAQISEVLQRGLLPSGLAQIPGVETAVVYEPTGGTCAGGDFYDVFPAGNGRWCFALGDVCGNGPEAAVVTGLARPVLRLLAREGYGVSDVLDRLNRTLGEQAVEVAASDVAAEGPGESRFLSLLYGELVPYDVGESTTTAHGANPGQDAGADNSASADGPGSGDAASADGPDLEVAASGGGSGSERGAGGGGSARVVTTRDARHARAVRTAGNDDHGAVRSTDGRGAGSDCRARAEDGDREQGRGVRCTLASAGHPLPLLLRADGEVAVRAAPQLLLGVVDDVRYESESFDLLPGETLLCVTDGVTERRSNEAQFDDDDGLARVLSACDGLTAQEVAQRVRGAVHAFAASPPGDDLAMLVLQAAR